MASKGQSAMSAMSSAEAEADTQMRSLYFAPSSFEKNEP
jgi:hypothetical protein